MKNIFTFLFLIASLGLGAQSLEIREAPSYIQFDPQTPFVETGLTVYNRSDSAIAVVAERVDNQVSGSQYDYFCWEVCYGATVNRSIGAIQIRPDKSTDAFTLTFFPEGEGSPVQVRMRFYNRSNPSDYVEHTFHFGTSATPIEAASATPQLLSQPYPNPARSIARLDYSLPMGTHSAQLILFNLIGKRIAHFPLAELQGRAQFSVVDYPAGIYMVSLLVEGQSLATRRLIVIK